MSNTTHRAPSATVPFALAVIMMGAMVLSTFRLYNPIMPTPTNPVEISRDQAVAEASVRAWKRAYQGVDGPNQYSLAVSEGTVKVYWNASDGQKVELASEPIR